MKLKIFTLRVAALLVGVIMVLFGAFTALTAFAEESGEIADPVSGESSYVEESVISEPDPDPEPEPQTEAPEPVTEPETQPEPEPVTEPPHTAAPTERPDVTEEAPTEYIGRVDPEPDPTEFFEPPTVPKTVSEKTYSTNYTAGVVSWICVAVGLIVVFAVIISTKAGGRKQA